MSVYRVTINFRLPLPPFYLRAILYMMGDWPYFSAFLYNDKLPSFKAWHDASFHINTY